MSTIGTTPVAFVTGPLLIQNLGPDPLYVGHSTMDDAPLVTAEAGLRLVAGESVAVGPTSSRISVVSSGTSDVRRLSSGLAMFATAVPPT